MPNESRRPDSPLAQEADSSQQRDFSTQEVFVYYELELPCWLLGLGAVCLAAALLSGCYLYQVESSHWADMRAAYGVEVFQDDHANPPVRSLRLSAAQLTAQLGKDNARLFALLDRDGNGLVSITEYEALAHHVRLDADHPSTLQASEDSLFPCGECGEATEGGTCVQLRYNLAPPLYVAKQSVLPYIRYDPVRKTLAPAANDDQKNNSSLAKTAAVLADFAANGTVDNITVAVDSVTIATALLPRLPMRLDQLRLGEPYTLIGPAPAGLQYFYSKQCRIRPGVYFEPGDVALATLLRPLHRHVFLYPRHDAGRDSAAAVLRAESPSHLELAFRLHTELQLAAFGAHHSVYLTPEGLEGRVIIQRHSGNVEYLEIGLPQSAVGGKSFCHIESPHDILETGFVSLPQLSVTSIGNSASFSNWTAELPVPAAFSALRSHMLPHLAAQFHPNLSAAIAANGKPPGPGDAKPIHVVLAIGSSQFGCDPSCRALRDFAFTDKYVMLRLRHYYTNVWINLADSAAVTEFYSLTGVPDPTAKPFLPLTCQLLHPGTLQPMASYESADLRKALEPPDGLPNPLPPTPEAVLAGAEPNPRRQGNLLSPQSQGEEPPEDPGIRFPQEQEAMDSIKRQVADSYLNFLMSSRI